MIGKTKRMVINYESGANEIPISIGRIKYYSELNELLVKEKWALKVENKRLNKRLAREEDECGKVYNRLQEAHKENARLRKELRK